MNLFTHAQKRFKQSMSIIHDALKKVQQSFQRKASSNSGEQPPEEEKKKFSPLNLFFSLVLLGACLFFGYTQLLKHWDRIRLAFDLPNIKLAKIEIPKISLTTSTPETKTKTLSENRTPVPIAEIKTPNTQENINIQGILSQGGKTVALINDKIYEEGDVIGSIKIISIDTTGIKVLNNGIEETIRVRP